MLKRREFLLRSSQTTLGLLLCPSISRAQPTGQARFSDLQKLIPQLMNEARVPGLGMAIVQEGAIAWTQGFGVRDAATNQPVGDHTLFEAASVSKTVFAYAVMQLSDKGILDLDKPLTNYASTRFLADDPQLDMITARHALSHSTGFQDWRSRREPLKIHFKPGSKYLYSGEGYHYLQSVVTQLIGKVDRSRCARYEADFEVCATDIDACLKRTLLSPLGMTTSGYLWNDTLERHASKPHGTDGKPKSKSKPTEMDAARYASAGGLHTTATEYARFLVEIVNPTKSDAFRIRPATLKEMIRPQVKLEQGEKVDGADSWALGWGVREHQTGNILVHSGGQDGFRSLAMASVKNKSGFIILTNSDNGGQLIHNARLTAILGQVLTEKA